MDESSCPSCPRVALVVERIAEFVVLFDPPGFMYWLLDKAISALYMHSRSQTLQLHAAHTIRLSRGHNLKQDGDDARRVPFTAGPIYQRWSRPPTADSEILRNTGQKEPLPIGCSPVSYEFSEKRSASMISGR